MRQNKILLTPCERTTLINFTHSGDNSAKKILHAHILLMCDEGGTRDKIPNKQISLSLNVHRNTIRRIKQKFLEKGLDAIINDKSHRPPGNSPKLNSDQNNQLITLYYSTPPNNKKSWSLRQLAKELVSRGIVDQISHETIRRYLNKLEYDLGR